MFTKPRQKIRQNWKGINKGYVFSEYKKKPLSKIDKTISKRTFIDDIILKNSKKHYPIPGPGAHFLDAKLAKKWHSKKKELFTAPRKEGHGKSNFARSKRSFNVSRKGKGNPAPGHCQLDVENNQSTRSNWRSGKRSSTHGKSFWTISGKRRISRRPR